MKNNFRILHLSDLHIDKDSIRDQRVVLRSLFGDIEHTVKKEGPYDLVFFTGDLIAKGAYSDTNKDLAIREFLVPLMEAAQISPERLFLAPGNHDVCLKEQSGLLATAQKSLASEDAVAKYLDETVTTSLNTGLEGFNSILERIDNTKSAVLRNSHYRAHVIDIDGVKVGIACLNSAWHATGAASDGDYGRLYISRKQFDEVSEAVRDAEIKIALAHHPIKWLTPKDSQNAQRQLLLHFDAFFHGHNHEPDAHVTTGTSNNYFVSNAGCLYQHRDYFNGYCSVTYQFQERRWSIRAREYFEARQAFDVAPRFGPNGEAEFIRSAELESRNLPMLPSDEYIEALHSAVDSRLLSALVSDVAPRSLKSIFVEPRLSRISQRKIEANQKNGNDSLFVQLKEILQLRRNTIFLGSKDMGKTTLLHRICQLCLESGMGEMPPFSAYVNLSVAGDTQAALIESIVAFGGGHIANERFLPCCEMALFLFVLIISKPQTRSNLRRSVIFAQFSGGADTTFRCWRMLIILSLPVRFQELSMTWKYSICIHLGVGKRAS